MRALFLLSLVTAPLLTIGAAQADLPGALDRIASAELARQKIPGLAAVAVKDGQVAWAVGLGVAHLESKTPVAPVTLFRPASGRVFLAAVISELSAQGRLRLDTPVGDYLFGLAETHARLTARKLLSPP